MTDEGAAPPADMGVREIEVRLLDGPNLYFPKPALKVSLALAAYATLGPREARALARSIGQSGGRPGRPGSETRQRWLMRLVRYVVRRLARESGVTRIAVRTRQGGALDEVVVALPWRHRTRARVTGEALAPLLRRVHADGVDVDEVFRVAAAAVAGADAGPPPAVIGPSVPVVSITGTNGKTTTTRMIGHIVMTAGLTAAWSSTDGVVVMGEVVEPGDYSGPAGARAVLQTPGLDIAILETARGGMLLKGMGVTANDVSVVTNVSADHLGLQGIDTLDQLAEVKAIVTTVTKAGGWAVLNGEDPRVWAMRARTKAQPWAFALHADAPALREAVNAGGRGITVLDGDIVVLYPDGRTDRLAPVVDVPLTLAGLSEHNIANCLAAAAAALALGIERDAVVEGLRTFAPDPTLNSGRMNTYTFALTGADEGGRESATVVVDMAHNEAGLEALLAVCAGLRAPGGRTLLALGAAGDRSGEALSAMGELAVRGAEIVVIAHKERYLRGRTVEELSTLLRAG
ncbi:MAG TPA: Mur ligase family protein, partial [Candidatus Lustribacter sp.]|nr:Mur ligase family protein [Candidatus Lustribacter sp.]